MAYLTRYVELNVSIKKSWRHIKTKKRTPYNTYYLRPRLKAEIYKINQNYTINIQIWTK